jgi:N-acetylmuramoyl-L-alanine amidase
MGKRLSVFIATLLLVASTLWATSAQMRQLEVYDAQMRTANNDELLRIFHALKSIYIQSIISSDDTLKVQTLERLVKSAKILKLDSSKYESELSLLRKENKETKHIQAPPARIEPSGFPKELTNEKPKNTLPATFKGKNVLHNVVVNDKNIVLEFGSDVSEQGTKVFGLNSSDSYKKVIDIPAIILNAPLAIKTPSFLQHLRISQYNGDMLRVVMDAQKPFDIYASILEKKVTLSFEKPSPIVHEAPKPSAQEKYKAPPPPMPVMVKNSKFQASKTIVIDAGHGGKDAGATGYKGRKEKGLVLDMAYELGKSLKQRGYKVFYTRQKDVFINLRDRTKVANDKNADLFISLHANAAPNEAKKLSMNGLETFFLSPDRSERSKNVAALENQSDMEEMDFYSKETFLNVFNREKIVLSNKAAIDIQSGMLKSVKKKYDVDDGGVREAPFWVLVGATMPSVLIELGYITNPEESDKMFNAQYQKLLVEGMSDGIDNYFINNP